MIRRSLVLLAMMSLTVASMAGCESLRQSTRSSHDAELNTTKTSGVETDPNKILAIDADAKNPKPFFKNNRSTGGWSSEAREIENHLGVGQ